MVILASELDDSSERIVKYLGTKDAVNYLLEALESGQSEVLAQYLSAMGRFHTYSFLCCQQIGSFSHRPDYVSSVLRACSPFP